MQGRVFCAVSKIVGWSQTLRHPACHSNSTQQRPSSCAPCAVSLPQALISRCQIPCKSIRLLGWGRNPPGSTPHAVHQLQPQHPFTILQAAGIPVGHPQAFIVRMESEGPCCCGVAHWCLLCVGFGRVHVLAPDHHHIQLCEQPDDGDDDVWAPAGALERNWRSPISAICRVNLTHKKGACGQSLDRLSSCPTTVHWMGRQPPLLLA